MVEESQEAVPTEMLQDRQSEEDFTRSPSIEDLVKSPYTLPLGVGGVPLSLNVALGKLFDIGWTPDRKYGGMVQLAEETILWLKSIDKAEVPPTDLPEVLQELLKSFRRMARSTKELQELKDGTYKKVTAARRAVEVRYQQEVTEGKGEEELSKKKVAFEGWLSNKEAEAENAIAEFDQGHAEVRSAFESHIDEVINLAFDEYKDSKAKELNSKSTELGVLDEDSSLQASLDAELDMALASEEAPPAEKTVVQTATDVFSNLQNVIGNTLQDASIPETLKSHLVESVQNFFKNSFQPEPAGEVAEKDIGEKDKKKDGEVVDKTSIDDKNKNNQPSSEPPSGSDSHRVQAVQAELARKDTSQLEQEDLEKDQVIVDGKVFYKTAKGKLETKEEREQRLAHNSYMRFSRSMKGPWAQFRLNHLS